MVEGLYILWSFFVYDSVCILFKFRNGIGIYIFKLVRFYYLFVFCEFFNCNVLVIFMDLYVCVFSFFLVIFWGKMLLIMCG